LTRSADELAWAIAEASRSTTLVSPDIAAMTPYAPSPPWRALAGQLGVDEGELLMMHANENALGPSPLAIEYARRALEEAHLYPDGGAQALKTKLAEIHQIDPSALVIGNGSNEIIELLVRTFVGQGETVVTAWPSFVVYRLAGQAAGREVLFAPLRGDRYDLATMASLVDRRTKLVFIANPNNPTGTYVGKKHLSAFLDRIPRSVIVVLDEAYYEYAVAEDYPNGIEAYRGHQRLVVLRTFSKAYGLAGLRVGYGVMDPQLAHYIDCVRQPYNTSAIAQAAAIGALEDRAHLETSVRTVRDGLLELEKGVARLGLKSVASQANFLIVRFEREAAPYVAALKARGILVRDMRGYDMPETIRVTVGTRAMNLRFLSILEELLKEIT
jgi:histidinol-phosphate aminotransferase